MNTIANSASPPPASGTLSRRAKETLLRQMYTLPHWIDVIRLIGYQTLPMETARKGIMLLAEKYGKEVVASASEILVEIFTKDNEAFARLKPHIRQMAFQILGPEPPPGAVPPMIPSAEPVPNPQTEKEPAKRGEKKRRPKHAKPPAATAVDAGPATSGRRDALMEQYRAAKEKHPSMLLLFRMGDFYELFEQDAETASKLLGLTLTTHDRTISMAGFPHHQLEAYLHKLLHGGQRVAICEPVEESLARGPIRREVTRVVTPKSRLEGGKLHEERNREPEEDSPAVEDRPVRQPRHFILKQFEAWLNEVGLAFVAIEDVRRTTPAVTAYVGVLDFIVMRGDEKLLVTVRPRLQAKHVKAIRELQNLFGPEYKPTRTWPGDGPDGWNWHDYAIDISQPDAS